MGGVLVRKHLKDKFRDVDAKEEKGMTHGLLEEISERHGSGNREKKGTGAR